MLMLNANAMCALLFVYIVKEFKWQSILIMVIAEVHKSARGDKAIFIELLANCCVGYFLEQAQYSRCCF